MPGEPGIAGSFTGMASDAPSSRATPLWHSRSGRLAGTSITIWWSATGTTSVKRVPGAALVSTSMIPA